jgi:hypothetical protein
MALVPGHSICPTCALAGRVLTGTYRIVANENGECTFTLQLSDPSGQPITITGVVAFQGLVLMFQAATDPSLGEGLALRSDTLRGQ